MQEPVDVFKGSRINVDQRHVKSHSGEGLASSQVVNPRVCRRGFLLAKSQQVWLSPLETEWKVSLRSHGLIWRRSLQQRLNRGMQCSLCRCVAHRGGRPVRRRRRPATAVDNAGDCPVYLGYLQDEVVIRLGSSSHSKC